MLPQRSPTQLRSCPAERHEVSTSSICKPTYKSEQLPANLASQPATSVPDPTEKERKRRGMDGYRNLESSPPVAAAGKARRSLELTNTRETKPWESLALGAVTLARTFSTGSQRFCRSGSQRSRAGGLPGALRRAFSMRRPPAGPGMGDGYWRIHDMDGDSDRGDDTLVEHGEEAEEAQAGEEKKKEDNEQQEAAGKEAADANRGKKKRGGIFKACKKLLRL